ncbi:MAG: peptidoglycan bridge formation glycyltransferase FemA/FemB family protein [Anaerolineae bacterium]
MVAHPPVTVAEVADRATWHAILSDLPLAHILQTWDWGEFKRRTTGWQPERLAYSVEGQPVAAAQVLTRRIGPFRVMYISRGPALDYTNELLVESVFDHLQGLARRPGVIWLKIDPALPVGYGVPGEEDAHDDPTGQQVIARLKARGWQFSASQVQFRNTITVDLTPDPETLLMNMRQSTRRKVRTAAKKGVTIRPGTLADLPLLYDLYRTTGERDGFLTRPLDYYREAWGSFMQAGMAQPLIAEFEGRPLAHVILMHFGTTCWYFYGASSNEERQRMPNYALQWEAIQWAKAQGYATYDFWGAPDTFDESDRMWGVYEFKRGFGGTVTRTLGAWDFAPNPALYWAYETLMPRILAALRRRTEM